jgi:RNA polymerase sigma factor (sigma-70 family)
VATEEPPSPESDSAFAVFYRTRWHDAARWGAALCGNVHRGEEAAQEAFVRIAPRYAGLDNPEAYLRRTLVNVVHETHRSASRRDQRERRVARLTVVADPDTPTFPDPALFAALEMLPAQQRAVLVLRYWADWDEQSIADALGCRRATVRSHAKRGLDHLRARLEERS